MADDTRNGVVAKKTPGADNKNKQTESQGTASTSNEISGNRKTMVEDDRLIDESVAWTTRRRKRMRGRVGGCSGGEKKRKCCGRRKKRGRGEEAHGLMFRGNEGSALSRAMSL